MFSVHIYSVPIYLLLLLSSLVIFCISYSLNSIVSGHILLQLYFLLEEIPFNYNIIFPCCHITPLFPYCLQLKRRCGLFCNQNDKTLHFNNVLQVFFRLSFFLFLWYRHYLWKPRDFGSKNISVN